MLVEGSKLKQLRLDKDISLADAAKILCLKTKYLNELENDNLHAFLPEVYVTGYKRLYINFLNYATDVNEDSSGLNSINKNLSPENKIKAIVQDEKLERIYLVLFSITGILASFLLFYLIG